MNAPLANKEKQSTKSESAVVIGAGIIGICTALYLQKQGLKVTLMDANGIAQGCSKGNAGHFATEQVFPLADKSLLIQLPKMLLDPLGPFRIRWPYLLVAMPWFMRFVANMRLKKVSAHTKALRALNEQALSAFTPLLQEAKLEHMLIRQGSLLVFEKPIDISVHAQYQAFKQQGIDVELLNREQLHQLEPNLSDKTQCALWFKEVGHTYNPEELSTGLAEHFIARGGKFISHEVESVQPTKQGSEIWHNGQISTFDHTVIAAGAWSKKLLKPLNYNVPLAAERGYHLMVEEHNQLSRPVASAERKFIMTPMSDGLRLAGTVEFASLNSRMNDRRAEVLLPHARQLLRDIKQSDAKPLEKWMGSRPSLPDSLPVIGQAPNHRNLYFAFGHQHLGLTQAAITGKLISELITKQPSSLDISPFCISRFQ